VTSRPSSDKDDAYLPRFGYRASNVGFDAHFDAGPEVFAPLMDLGVDEYGAIHSRLTHELKDAAAELGDADWLRHLDSLPWRGKTVLAIGDSITADVQSWSRILSAVLEGRAAHRETRLVSLALSGETTTGLLSRLSTILALEPDYVLILIGTNDAQGHPLTRVPWISDEETERNLRVLGSVLSEVGASLVWLAPPPFRLEDIARHWYVGELPIEWSVERHEAKRQIVLAQDGLTFDTASVIGERPEDFLDGIHPSLEGHLRLAEGLVNALPSPSA
jgi:acyl-CoA thioesterase-1